jgi:threonylcarbamoyladenosine tRNA methylthiotransferase MtaB
MKAIPEAARVAFMTLGCKVNQVETEQFKAALLDSGYTEAAFTEAADVYIINTCSVTHVSDRKSRAMIRRAVRLNPRALVVVTGCMAQEAAGEVSQIPGVSLVVGNGGKPQLPALVEEMLRAPRGSVRIVRPELAETGLKSLTSASAPQSRSRAFIKIQDGCESCCTFCIVPQVRGPVRSKAPEEIIREIEALSARGYQEVVLTGIHIGQYGKDLKTLNLAALLETLLTVLPEPGRIRLGSIEPLEFDRALLDCIANSPRICPHFHIPLQSGSAEILRRMNRRYRPQLYRDLILELARLVPGAALAADVMVGFPGETEENYQETRDLIESLPLMDLHVFKYSRRPGTVAYALPDQVAEADKAARAAELIKLAAAQKQAFLHRLLGTELSVVVEREISPGYYSGLSGQYAETRFALSAPAGMRKILSFQAESVQEESILGRII